MVEKSGGLCDPSTTEPPFCGVERFFGVGSLEVCSALAHFFLFWRLRSFRLKSQAYVGVGLSALLSGDERRVSMNSFSLRRFEHALCR
jgi:hypothetical protein